MFRDDEFFVWSWSSAFSMCSLIKDDLVSRYPICMVAERHMVDDTVFRLELLVSSVCDCFKCYILDMFGM